jgi:hypothetical protein
MDARTVVPWIACAVACASSYWFWHELQQERRRVVALDVRITDLESGKRHTRPELVSPAPPGSPFTAQSPEPVTEPESVSEIGPQAQARIRENWNRRIQDPRYREAFREQRRLELASAYFNLARVLDVPAETVDRMLLQMADWELEDSFVEVESPQTNEEYEAYQAERQERQRLRDQELETLLGPDKFALWKQYQATLDTRNQVQELRARLASTNDPLRDDQVESLVAAIHAEQQNFEEEISGLSYGFQPASVAAMSKSYIERATASQERIHDTAATVLSAPQLNHLDRMLQSALKMTIAQMQLAAAESTLPDVPTQQDLVTGMVD